MAAHDGGNNSNGYFDCRGIFEQLLICTAVHNRHSTKGAAGAGAPPCFKIKIPGTLIEQSFTLIEQSVTLIEQSSIQIKQLTVFLNQSCYQI